MDINLLRRIIRQESPSRFLDGTVVGTDPRGTRTASVRVSGGRVHTRVYTCDDALEVGDQVICARMESLDRLVVIGRIRSKHGSPLSQHGVLAPPSNFAALSFPGIAYCQWDTYPGECTSWEVEHALQADKSDKASVLVSRGSYYLYPCDPGTTVYFRARALRWLSDNNLMYSGWSGWSSVVCDKYEVPRLLVELTNKAGKQVEEGWVVVIDKANASSFKTTVGADDEDVIGVAFETIADNAVGLVCISGLVDVYVSDAPAIGDYLISSVTEGNATGDVTATKGTFGRALTTKAGNTVSALLDPPLSGTSGGLPDVAGAGYALVSDGVNSWAVDLTPPWLGTHTWGSGFNVMPADASGQDLGDTTHRWDLYTQDVIFGGATGANVITVPDNVADALHVKDAGGLEYARVVSTNANPYYLIDPTGAGIKVGIGVAPNQALTVEGTIDLKEQAAANADTVAYGQIWVKSTAPNELWFTDDAGTDVQLGLGAGGLPAVAGAGYALVSDGVNSWVSDQTPAWTGEHSFGAGAELTGATGVNAITMPDNLANALHIIDAGDADVYLQIVTTTGSEEVIFNAGGDDVDFTVQAVGVADALQIRGSDGQITLGALTAGYVKSSADGVLSVATEVPLIDLGSYTQGDLIYGGAADWQDLAIGAIGDFLWVNAAGTEPEWHTLVVGDIPAHALLGSQHSDTTTDAPTRGSIITGNATPAWDELVHPGTAYHLQTDANDVGWAQNITMADGAWQGIGAGLERIVFDAAGDITVMGAKFGVNVAAPTAQVEATSNIGVTSHFTTTKANGNTNAVEGTAITANTGDNCAFYASASNAGAGDAYSFYGIHGIFYNADPMGIGIVPTAPLTVQADVSAFGIRVVGRGDDYGLLQFFENDGVTLEGVLCGYAGRLTISGPGATSDLCIVANGSVGIATLTIPHGGVGMAKFAIEGPDGSTAGPHVQITTAADDYPLLEMMMWTHDNVSFMFDAYYDGAYRSSDAGSNLRILKAADALYFRYDSGVAQGAVITWNDGFVLDLVTGQVKIPNLAGAGNRAVVAAADGTLSAP